MVHGGKAEVDGKTAQSDMNGVKRRMGSRNTDTRSPRDWTGRKGWEPGRKGFRLQSFMQQPEEKGQVQPFHQKLHEHA